jgi:3-oxoacyl-[acyl-carrier-protein] synthase-3
MPASAVLCGLGAVVPPRIVTNQALAERLKTSDEWIYTRTGIKQRHVVGPDLATGDLAVEAGRRALRSAADGGADMVVLATVTPDHACPATAPEVAFRLGLGYVPAFDISAVCTGFVYALGVAAGAIAGGLAARVLVIGAETFSTILDPSDRDTAVIFGDGAGAVVLRAGEPGEPGELRGFDLGSDGELSKLIMIPGGGSRQRTSGRPADPAASYFQMQGRDVFKQALKRMAFSTQAVLQRTGWGIADLDWLVGHQANVRILHAIADQIGLVRDKLVINIDRVGNTCAASIPLALTDFTGTIQAGQRVVLTAFGGGLTWGSTALVWPALDVASTDPPDSWHVANQTRRESL